MTTTELSDSLTFSDTIAMQYGSVLDLMYAGIWQMEIDIQSTFGTSSRVIQVANVKDVDVQRAGNAFIIIPKQVGTHVFGQRNYYMEYGFQIRVYSNYMSSTEAFSKYWRVIDNYMRNDLMSFIVGTNMIKGGVVVGYASSGDFTPSLSERGIRYANYDVKLEVLF